MLIFVLNAEMNFILKQLDKIEEEGEMFNEKGK